jgi:glycosyltransferase involved in cell wall biosynthesis
MVLGKKVVVVLPAFRAEKTLERTVKEVPAGVVDEFILVDDASPDRTALKAKELGLKTFVHEKNLGYGGNQKTCYTQALASGADVVIMLHPDYQYNPKLVPVLAHMVASDIYDVVLASRILGKGALKGGMPLYKYIFNRFLTAFENLMIDLKLSEYHTGYRAFSRSALEKVDWRKNSDDFVFDNEILVQMQYAGLRFGEISCPTLYFDDASSINFSRSLRYGLGVLGCAMKYRLQKWRLARFALFAEMESKNKDSKNLRSPTASEFPGP